MCVVQIRTFPFRQDFREMRSIFSSFPGGLLPGPDVLDLENHRRLPSAAVDGILDKLNIRLESHGGRHLGHIRQFNAVFIPVHVRAVLFSPLLPEETEAQVSVIGCAFPRKGERSTSPVVAAQRTPVSVAASSLASRRGRTTPSGCCGPAAAGSLRPRRPRFSPLLVVKKGWRRYTPGPMLQKSSAT